MHVPCTAVSSEMVSSGLILAVQGTTQSECVVLGLAETEGVVTS